MRHYKKDKNSIRIEDIILGEGYKISINPASQPVSIKRIDKWYSEQVNVLQGLLKYNIVCLCLEASPTGRLHFHGVYEINDMKEHIRFLSYLNLTSTYDIDYIDDKSYWFDYCIKQDYYFEKILLQYPCVAGGTEEPSQTLATGNELILKIC